MFYMWTQCCCDSKKKKTSSNSKLFHGKITSTPHSVFESLISYVLVIFLKAEPRFINF